MNDGVTEGGDGRMAPTGGRQETASQVFIVRVWEEPVPGGGEWHGRVQHVLRGESRAFEGLEMLATQIESMLGGSGGGTSPVDRPGK